MCYQKTQFSVTIYEVPELGNCKDRAQGSCLSNTCTFVGSRCLEECEIGRGYETCNRIGDQIETHQIGSNMICEQKHNKVKILPASFQSCCVRGSHSCHGKGRFCKRECVVGLGYYHCDSAGRCEEELIPRKNYF